MTSILTNPFQKAEMLPEINRSLYCFTRAAAKIALSPFFKVVVEGRADLPPEGSLVLLCKHQCWQDIPLLGLASPRPLYYVAKQELFLHPLARWFVSSLGGVPLNRKRPLASRDSIRDMVRLIRSGERVVVFPEGTYYKGKMGPGHSGIIRAIQARAEVPFVPVGIHYNGGKIRRPVRIRFGHALHMDRSTGIDEFLGRVMRAIADLSDLPFYTHEHNSTEGWGVSHHGPSFLRCRAGFLDQEIAQGKSSDDGCDR